MAAKQSGETDKQGGKDKQQEANLGQKEAREEKEKKSELSRLGEGFRESSPQPEARLGLDIITPHSAISSRVEQGRARRPAHRLCKAVSPVRGKPYLASRPTFLPCPYFFSAPGPVLPLPTLSISGCIFSAQQTWPLFE